MINKEKLTKEEIKDLVARNKAAGDILAILHSFGWKYLEATEDEREVCAWVSPEGKWYNVTFSHHNTFATYVCKDLFPKEDLGLLGRKCSEILIKHGWISIYNDIFVGSVLRGYQHMSEEQYRELLSFFKDERLFRGWTIRAMWLAKEDMKEQSKDD